MRWFIVVITLAVGLPAFFLGRIIWPDTPSSIIPPSNLLPFFLVPSLIEALAFGGGVAFLLVARPTDASAARAQPLATAAYVSTAWLLMAPWLHGNLHRHLGFDLTSIARIEWAIHLTMLLAAVIAALFVARLARDARPSRRPTAHATSSRSEV
jgi:hypothetical protein